LDAPATSIASHNASAPGTDGGDALPETGGLTLPALALATVAPVAAGAVLALRDKW